MSPTAATLKPSATQKFSVQNPGTNVYVWSVYPNTGTISSLGLYTAPASILASSTVAVYATSPGHPVLSATVTLVPNVSIAISPTWISMTNGQSAPFTATVTGASNTAVTWLTPLVGTITSGGVYTVPATLNTSQTVTLTVKSVVDPTKSVSATHRSDPHDLGDG